MKNIESCTCNEKPYAGNPHVRLGVEEVASAATPRRGALSYGGIWRKMAFTLGLAIGASVLLASGAVWGQSAISNSAPLCSWEERLASGYRARSAAMQTNAKSISGDIDMQALTVELQHKHVSQLDNVESAFECILDGTNGKIGRLSFADVNGIDYVFASWCSGKVQKPLYYLAEGYQNAASTSLSNAVDFLKSKLLTDGKPCIVKAVKIPVSPNDHVVKGAFSGNVYDNPFNRSWFFFIDDSPFANWSHPARYVFVAEDLSAFAVRYSNEPVVVLDGNAEIDLENVFDNFRKESKGVGFDEWQKSLTTGNEVLVGNALSYTTGDTSHTYVVLISGGGNRASNHSRYWGDVAMFYSTLRLKYNIPKDHFKVLISDGTDSTNDMHDTGTDEYRNSPSDLDGDGVSDITGSATKGQIRSVFQSLANTLTASDQLFVFVTDHGTQDDYGTDYLIPWLGTTTSFTSYDQVISSSEFASYVSNISAPTTFVLEFCFSGGFISGLKKQSNRVIATACGANEESSAFVWQSPSGSSNYILSGAFDYCNPWAFAFNAAIRGCDSKWTTPWQDEPDGWVGDADANGDGLVSMYEAARKAESFVLNTTQTHSSGEVLTFCDTPGYGESTSGLGNSFYVLKQSSGVDPRWQFSLTESTTGADGGCILKKTFGAEGGVYDVTISCDSSYMGTTTLFLPGRSISNSWPDWFSDAISFTDSANVCKWGLTVSANDSTQPRYVYVTVSFKELSQRVLIYQEGKTQSTQSVTFNVNDGTSCASREYTVGSTYGSLPTTSKTGYTFDGWYTTSSFSTRVTEGSIVSSSVTTLHAKWTAISYSVVYSLDGGTHGSNHPSSATYDTAFYVSAPSKTGYTFAGWTVTSGLNTSTAKWGTTSSPSTSLTSSTTKCANGATGNVYFKNLRTTSGSVTLTANWTETPTVTLSAALDNTALSFTTGGSSSWLGQTTITHDGVDAARSGALGNNQTNWLQTTVSGPGTISFWWYASSEVNYDYLEFLVDGSVIWSISGTNNVWTSKSHAISTSGTHTLQWRYRKDDTRYRGEDAGFVDQVTWTPQQAGIGTHDKVQLWENGPYWATTNIGAEKPEDYGYYFWWGDTVGYTREGDAWVATDGSSSNFSFSESNVPTTEMYYDTLQSEGWIVSQDGVYVLAPAHDAAHVKWGGNWRMPTYAEQSALINNCDWIWASKNGVNGCEVRGRGDYASNSIFLPCSGSGNGTLLYFSGSYGDYWSSVPSSGIYYSLDLYFSSSGHSSASSSRRLGFPVRPVQGFTSVETYIVTLDRQNGSGGTESVPAIYGNAMPSITVPTRSGYTFGGYWTGTNGSGTQYYTASGASARTWNLTSATTLYAKWTPNTYTVSYSLNGGTHGNNHPSTPTYDTAFYISAPSKTGYTFAGWTVTSGLNTTTAKWGTTSSPSTSLTSASTKCINGATGDIWFLNLTPTAGGSITLTANWAANTYTVTLDYQSGSGGTEGVTATYGSAMPAITVPTRSGYTFGGYWTGTNGSGTQYYTESGTSARTWNLTSATTLYAKWTANTYTVSYSLNGGTHGNNHPSTPTYDTAFYVSAPSKTGYTFAGWTVTSGLNTSTAKYGTSSSSQTTSITSSSQKCKNGATGDIWFLNLTSTANGSVTLTANWTANTYSVTLDRQGGSGGTASVTATYGSSMPSITKPTRDGYVFGGYYSSTGGSGTQYYNAAGVSARSWSITSATTLYAYWIVPVPLSTALDNASLTFTTGGSTNWVGGVTNQFYYGGSSAQSGAITHSQSTWMQTTVSGPGTLSFWYKVSSESVCDKLIFYIDGTNRLTKSGTSISSWQQFTCVVSNNTQHVCKWTYSKDGSISSGGDCCWIDKVEWTPTIYNVECHNLYSDDGGMLYYHYITNGNWRIPGIETFTGGMFAGRNWSMRTGYAFAGWATNENGNVIYNDQQVLSLVADMVLYTQWTPIIYNMTYSLDGGTHGAMHPSTATYDTAFYVSAPTKSGYTFAGWTVTSGLNTDTAKWGATSSASTSLTSTTTKCVNGATGSVYFENLRSTTGSVTLKANWTCNHSSTSVQNAHAATCIAAGYTGDVVCGNCGAVVETGTSIPALGHQEGAGIVTQEPTTTADGVMTYYCARCGIVMRTEAIPKLATTCPDLRFATFRDWDFGYAMFTITNSEGDSVFSSAPVRLFECNKQFGIVYGYANTGDASISNVIVATRYEMVSETGVSVSQSDSETTLTLEPFWGSQSATFQMAWTNLAAGVYTARVTLDATTAISDTNRVNNVSEFVFAIRDPLSLDDAIGCNGLAFETSEDGWYGTRDGVDQTLSYARTKHLGNYGTNILSATVSDAGTLSFDWKVSSEANYDWLEFLVDGVVTNRISGANGTWQNCSYDFADGGHVVQWRYRKDGSYYGGLDCAWLANIIWTAAQHEPQAVAVPVVGVDGVEVAGETSVFYAESCTVSLVCSTPGAMIYYTTNGSTPRLSDRYKYTGAFTITDTTTIKAIAVLDNMKSEYSTVTIMKRVLSLGEAVSANTTGAELMWMTGGDATWMPVVDMTSTTGFSAQSGAIGDATGEDFSTTWLQTEVSGAGTISFRWKVDCERDDSGDATWDRIMFFTNGVEVARMDGASGWEELAFTFADAGTRTLRWEFVKDDYNEEAFTDRAWVSNFSWSPNNVVSPDPIPPVAMDAAPTVVSTALSGTADSNLTANVTNSAQYAAYRTWALSVTNDTTTAQMIKESTRTWLSYAFGADALIDKELTSDDVKIESFSPTSTDGKFDFTVSVKDVNIGGGSVAEETLKENLKKVLGVEGAATLMPDAFSSDNIDITFGAPVNGKAKISVSPPADAGNSFFMRVKVK